MKRLLLLVLLCVFAVSASLAQSAAPFKGANVLYIQTPDSAVVAWKKLAGVLTSAGYGIKSSDKDLLTLTTESSPGKRGEQVVLLAVVRDKSIQLRGTYSLPGALPGSAVISLRGMKGSPSFTAWERLLSAAKSYPSGKISYQED